MTSRLAASLTLTLTLVACGGTPLGDGPDAGPPDAAPVSYSILYTRWNNGPELALADVTGDQLAVRTLGGGVQLAGQAAVSPDGRRVVFQAWDTAASSWALVVRDLASGAETIVQHDNGVGMPSWSPDGTQLAYADFAGQPFTYHVLIVPAAGGTPRVIGTVTANADQAPCIGATWSPDGKEVAYSTITGLAAWHVDDQQAHAMIADGSALWTCAPAWSPDGKALAFAWGTSGVGHIMTIPRDGDTATPVAPMNAGMPAGQVKWSPDGKTLAFVGFDGDGALYVVDADGQTAPRLLDHLASSIAGGHPQWSPDGRQVLYLRYDGTVEDPRLMIVPAAGGTPTPTPLIGAAIDGTYPIWLATPIVR